MDILKLNSWGWAVFQLQMRLDIRPTFYFDTHTHMAVKAFQTAHGLKADGEVGPLTRKALDLKPADKKIAINPHKPWLAIAQGEIGEREWPGELVNSARIKEYHQTTKYKPTTDEIPWCSSHVNWVITQSGRKGTNNALANSWLDWEDGVMVTNPEPGDIVIVRLVTAQKTEDGKKPLEKTPEIKRAGYHVGFFIKKTGSGITILGGNQGPDGSASVNEANFLTNEKNYMVKGYRRPKGNGWSIFIKIGDILGGVTQKGFEGYTKIATLTGGVARNVSMQAGNLSNRETGRPVISPFAVTQHSDQATPQMIDAMLRGKVMKATIVMVATDGREHLRYELDNAILSGIALSEHDDGTQTTAFMLSYSRVGMASIPYDASGKAGSPLRVAYDVGAARLA